MKRTKKLIWVKHVGNRKIIVEQVSVDGPIVAGNIELIINTVINNANYKMNGTYNLVKYNLFINLVIVT